MKDRQASQLTLNDFLHKKLEEAELEKVATSLSHIIQSVPEATSREIVKKMEEKEKLPSKKDVARTIPEQFEKMILELINENDQEKKKDEEAKENLGENVEFEKNISLIIDKLKSIISLFPQNILEAPVLSIAEKTKNPSKSTLLTYFEMNSAFKNHFHISGKEGGDNPAGERGGIKGRLYEIDGIVSLQRMLVKQGVSTRETIGEQLLSQMGIAIAKEIELEVKDIIAGVYFTRDDEAKNKNNSLYISSIYLDNFQDVAQFTKIKRGLGIFGGQKTPEEDKDELVKKIAADKANSDIYKRTLGEIFAISLLFGNKQVHWNNVGVSTFVDGERKYHKFSIIDLGGFGRKEFNVIGGEKKGQFGKDVILDPIYMKRYANYFESYSDKIRQDPEFIKGFMKVVDFGGERLKEIINAHIDKLGKFCTIEEIQVFANAMDTEHLEIKKYTGDKERYLQDIKNFMFKTIYARQISLNQIVINWAKENKISELYESNPIYFTYKEKLGSLDPKLKQRIIVSAIESITVKDYKELNEFKEYLHYLHERSKKENVDNLILLALDRAYRIFPVLFPEPVIEKIMNLGKFLPYASDSSLLISDSDSFDEPASPSEKKQTKKP